jgi:hypothetical protein
VSEVRKEKKVRKFFKTFIFSSFVDFTFVRRVVGVKGGEIR